LIYEKAVLIIQDVRYHRDRQHPGCRDPGHLFIREREQHSSADKYCQTCADGRTDESAQTDAHHPAGKYAQPNSIHPLAVTDQPTGVTTFIPSPADYTISFFPDGTLIGKADCNTFDGTYSQKNGFSIRLGATTRMECGEASLSQEYLNLLSDVVAGGPDGAGGLALENAGGETRMLFRNGGTTVKP
jgi:heat shock protein HslJ